MPSDRKFKGRDGNNVDVSISGDDRAAGGADGTKSAAVAAAAAAAAAANDAPLPSVLSTLIFDEATTDLFFFAFVALETLGFDTPLMTFKGAE